MISGMYLGEIVRLICVKMVSEGLLFGGIATDKLKEKEAFLTKHVSDVERYICVILNSSPPIDHVICGSL